MKSRVQKWGNSLAVRIPKVFAEEARLSEDARIEMTVQEGALVIVADRRRKITLEKLLTGITRENIHTEVTTGAGVGDEAW